MKNNKSNLILSQEEQGKIYNNLVSKLIKQCETKNGYIGVEYDNIYYNQIDPSDTMSDVLFHRILVEIEALSDHGGESVVNEYDEDLPFKSLYYVGLHVKRLVKFIIKYAPKTFDNETSNNYIRQAKRYL